MTQDELLTIAAALQMLRDDVRTRMNSTDVGAESDALFLQILEITHRLQMINAILFKQSTEDLSSQVAAIQAGTAEIHEAIRDIERLANAIAGIKSVLGIVDSVIDLIA